LAAAKTLTVTNDAPLLEYLLATLAQNRKAVKNLLKYGAIAVNRVTIRQFDHPLVAGDVITVAELKSAIAANHLQYARIEIIYEDQSLLVLNKPAGLLTVATAREKADTLYVRLNDFLHSRRWPRNERAIVVHRLDQDTSGLVLFAKSDELKQQLQEAWPTVQKTYWAIVEGRPAVDQTTITSYLSESKSLQVHSHRLAVPGAKLATTHVRVLQTRGAETLVEVRLETGRKHQIRVHLAGLQCPVVGDERYGARTNPYGRLALHACQLAFTHPLSGQPLQFSCAMPTAWKWSY